MKWQMMIMVAVIAYGAPSTQIEDLCNAEGSLIGRSFVSGRYLGPNKAFSAIKD